MESRSHWESAGIRASKVLPHWKPLLRGPRSPQGIGRFILMTRSLWGLCYRKMRGVPNELAL